MIFGNNHIFYFTLVRHKIQIWFAVHVTANLAPPDGSVAKFVMLQIVTSSTGSSLHTSYSICMTLNLYQYILSKKTKILKLPYEHTFLLTLVILTPLLKGVRDEMILAENRSNNS